MCVFGWLCTQEHSDLRRPEALHLLGAIVMGHSVSPLGMLGTTISSTRAAALLLAEPSLQSSFIEYKGFFCALPHIQRFQDFLQCLSLKISYLVFCLWFPDLFEISSQIKTKAEPRWSALLFLRTMVTPIPFVAEASFLLLNSFYIFVKPYLSRQCTGESAQASK